MKYTHKELKQVIKNISSFAKHYNIKCNERDSQLIRHVYLAYQWIRSQDLMKTENPKFTKQAIRPELIFLIFNEWGYQMNIAKDHFYKIIEAQGFKVKRIRKERYENYSYFTGKSFLKAHYALLLNPSLSQKHLLMNKFWQMIQSLFTLSQYPANIKYLEKDYFIEFKNIKDSVLSLKFNHDYNDSKDIEFNFSIKNKYEVSGKINPKCAMSYSGNALVYEMIKEIAQNEKY